MRRPRAVRLRQDGTYRVYDSRCPHQVTNIPHLALHGTELTAEAPLEVRHHHGAVHREGHAPAQELEAKVESGRLMALW